MAAENEKSDSPITLTLLGAGNLTPEAIDAFCEKVTGKPATEADRARSKMLAAELNAKPQG